MSFVHFADIDEQCAKYQQLTREDIAKLSEWQIAQPHLPNPLHPIETALFLHSCYYSMEAAKQCIDAYYTFRTHCPDFFTSRDPFSPEMQLEMKTHIIITLPELTPEGYNVLYVRLIDCNPDVFKFNALVKLLDMIFTLRIKEGGCQEGVVAIIDMKGISMSHILKCSIINMKNFMNYLQTSLPVRLKSVHLVNSMPIVDKLLALMKPFIWKEFKENLYVHFDDNETIFKFVPKKTLPVECGGESFCAEEFYINNTRKEIEKHANIYEIEDKQLVDESKRPDKLKNVFELFGVDGTFKKLDVD